MDVLTPPIVENPGMETHIHPFEVSSIIKNKSTNSYLHTSPEFNMKKVLAETDLDNIFTISYCFRDEPTSDIHRNQFLMLEWYRKNKRYEKIMDDVESLITYSLEYLNEKLVPIKNNNIQFERVTMDELFQEFLNFSILDFLDTTELVSKIKKDHKDIPLPNVECDWDDYFFLIFLNKIEKKLENFPYILISEYPKHLSALSTISKKDPRVCERFEVYMSGIEICNCFNEITNYDELKMRFLEQQKDKKRIYNYKLSWPEEFLNTMKNYPQSAGIALGVERLLKSIVKTEKIFF